MSDAKVRFLSSDDLCSRRVMEHVDALDRFIRERTRGENSVEVLIAFGVVWKAVRSIQADEDCRELMDVVSDKLSELYLAVLRQSLENV